MKLYEVTCRGTKWQVEAANAAAVKHQVATKFGMKKMPKGTVVTKIGLVAKAKKERVKTPVIRRGKAKPEKVSPMTDRQRKVMEEFSVSDTPHKGVVREISPHIPVEKLSKSLTVSGCCFEVNGEVCYVSSDCSYVVPAGSEFRIIRKDT